MKKRVRQLTEKGIVVISYYGQGGMMMTVKILEDAIRPVLDVTSHITSTDADNVLTPVKVYSCVVTSKLQLDEPVVLFFH